MRKIGDNSEGVDGAEFDEMLGAIERDHAKFWSGFFKDFFGVSLVSHPVSVEVLEWACRVSMQAGLHPTLACAPKRLRTAASSTSRPSRGSAPGTWRSRGEPRCWAGLRYRIEE